ncbi:hypothetical protein Tco_0558183, partial [Tanacetum coccineum]
MEISIADQIALDDALVAPADRLKIGKCNLRLSSDVTSKEATLQVVYDVLKLTPFYKAFQVTADAPEIYMQEFLVGNKKFEEPPLEKEILAFLANLGHSGEIRKITDVNVNKLHQPEIPFASITTNKVDYAYLLWEDFTYQIENKNTKKGNAMNEDTQLYGAILPTELTNEDIRISESYKEYHAIASGKIPPKTKGMKPPTVPKEKKEKKSGKGKQKTTELETISEAVLTEAEQLKIITKRSRKETHSSHASGSGADEGTGVKPGVPDAPDYDSEDDISWKSSDDDQEDEKAQDDEDEDKNDVNETTQDDEDDDVHDDDENAQDDDDEEQTESEDDGDDFIHPKLTTHDDEIIHEEETDEDDTFDPIVHTPSRISSSDDEDSDNEVEGMDVEGMDVEDAEDQGNEAVEDTNTNLEGRDDVMTDAILPQVQATQEIEDTHVTLTPVNPDGQQQSSSVSSGFVSNMLNPNQDTGVDDIFEQHADATSLIDTPVTAIVEPSFSTPTPNPLTETNQYAEALSSIPGIVDQYLANKMQEVVDVAVQLKYDRIREESNTANQQFLDSIDEGMKKIIKEQVRKEVSKITPKIEKLVIDQLESKVLVRSSKEANTSHAVAANLSELELKKILIHKIEANNSNNSFRTRAEKDLPRDGADDDQEPSAGIDRGSKRRRPRKEPASTSAPSETTTTTAGKTTTT